MDNKSKCSYCGTEKKEDELIRGRDALICGDCVEVCNELINLKGIENTNQVRSDIAFKTKTPQKIIEHLNKYVIGQDKAKKAISTNFYNHYKRIYLNDASIQKSDMLITGPSGSGKTLLTSTVAKFLDIPFYSTDISKYSEVGYMGDDVDSILTGLLLSAGGDVKKAESGIIHLDEFDKISTSKDRSSSGVGSKSVQEELLKMIEGSEFYVSTNLNKKIDRDEKVKINTKNILFICSGAFEGIYDEVKKRHKTSSSIGFNAVYKDKNADDYDLLDLVEDEDFIKYGFMKEIVGRLPLKTYVKKLTIEDLVKILTEPQNSIIKSYQKLLKLDKVSIDFDEGALNTIAELSLKKNLGARGLTSILEKTLQDVMFEAPENESEKNILITKDDVLEKNKKELN